MIDIHTHVLPGCDDGPRSWESTLEMCQQAADDGVRHVVATPHANFEYEYDREAHAAKVDELRSRFPALQFSIGCDFHVSYDNVEDALKNPGRYTINDSRYLLVEFSDYTAPVRFMDPIFPLLAAGFIPIVTHPERNGVLLHHPEMVDELVGEGCLVQVTANSLTGFWGERPKKMAVELLKREIVHFIASDAHDPRRRTTVLSAGVKVAAGIIGEAAAGKLVNENPRAIVG
jgi:protein-tyrosine phosphatase